jgi:hypothetical protein
MLFAQRPEAANKMPRTLSGAFLLLIAHYSQAIKEPGGCSGKSCHHSLHAQHVDRPHQVITQHPQTILTASRFEPPTGEPAFVEQSLQSSEGGLHRRHPTEHPLWRRRVICVIQSLFVKVA